MLAIKAGGSVITRAGERPAFDRPAARRLAAALARLQAPFVLVHGTGSFGKPPARRHGYLSGAIPARGVPVPEIRADLLRLHSLFVNELVRAGLRAVSCPGAALFALEAGRPVLKDRAALLAWFARGCVPVVNSDIFPSCRGFRVVSSDALLGALCRALRPSLAVFLTSAPGVLDRSGRPVGEVRPGGAPALLRSVAVQPGDVSGGMRGKLREAAAIAAGGVPVLLLDGRRPERLAGPRAELRSRGTYIHAS